MFLVSSSSVLFMYGTRRSSVVVSEKKGEGESELTPSGRCGDRNRAEFCLDLTDATRRCLLHTTVCTILPALRITVFMDYFTTSHRIVKSLQAIDITVLQL